MPKVFLRTSKNRQLSSFESLHKGIAWKLALGAACLLVFFPLSAIANNVSVTQAGLIDQNTSNKTVQVQFNISWDNSWNDVTNNDAAWVFVKYCTSNCSTDGTWSHATMKTAGTNPSGVSRGTGTAIDVIVSQDKKGAFIQRTSLGFGTLSTNAVQLVWDYNADGVSDGDAYSANTMIKVFAIEMVHIPQADFSAGDGSDAASQNPASAGFKQSSATNCRDPWLITSEGAISVTNYTGACAPPTYYYTSSGATGEDATGSVFTIPANYPKGWAPFYIMKYEISQGQYRDFLNSLTRAQQSARVQATITADTIANNYVMSNQNYVIQRNGIRAPASGNGTQNPVVFVCDVNATGVANGPDSGQWDVMNEILWPDIAAYADWAALRPMSELEFEKAARGDQAPVNLEYAWRSTTNTNVTTVNSLGYIDENAITTSSTHAQASGYRCGILADATDSTRQQSGASYYGVLDLTGSGMEPTVTVGNATGRGFTGSHGDGALNSSGNATGNSDWPGYVSSQVTGNTGIGTRGGYTANISSTNGPVSARNNASNATYNSRTTNYYIAGRLVRTASA